jgi:hypothetical protein
MHGLGVQGLVALVHVDRIAHSSDTPRDNPGQTACRPTLFLLCTHHGAIVVVIAYCFAGFTVVGAGARTAITVVQKQGFHRDDIGYFGGAVSI